MVRTFTVRAYHMTSVLRFVEQTERKLLKILITKSEDQLIKTDLV